MNQLSKDILSIKTNKLTFYCFVFECHNCDYCIVEEKVEDFISLKRKKTKTRNLS